MEQNYAPLRQTDSGPPGQATFIWNNRECTGNELHDAVLDNDVERVKAVLKAQPDLLNKRFNYETMTPQGKPQEGSGVAIHLAVSRCSVDVAKVLVAAGADLTSMVTRGGQGHYDVLHACIFSEGRGGADDMVKYLLEAKAPMAQNLNGEFPLHKAFQTGKVGLINILREEREARGMPDLENVPPDHKQQTPLELGISMGKMTEDDLAEVAPLTPAALQVFTRHEPRCIRKWLARAGEKLSATDFAGHITMAEVNQVFAASPEAGDALLNAMVSEPEVANVGWHPLPTRVSFAARSNLEKCLFPLNLPRTIMPYYTTDKVWNFDAKTFKAPDWHRLYTDRSAGKPIRDVTWNVCHMPGLASPEFFAGIADTPGDDDLFIYDNPVVKSLISYVWWEAAWKISLLQIALTVWGLALLMTEQWVNMEIISPEGGYERLLTAHGHARINGFLIGIGSAETKLNYTPLAAKFVGARGIVELFHEILTLVGYMSVGKTRNYFRMQSLKSILNAVLPLIIFLTNSHELWVFGVMIYWSMLLTIMNISEKVARAMLPISQTANSLGPSAVLTLLGFCAFTHAFFIIREGEVDFANLFLLSFSTLLTGSLPSDAGGNQLFLYLTYAAVIAFTVFFLNIFIGVISEQYTTAEANVALRFQEVLADECMKFLLRAKHIPVCKFGQKIAVPCILALGAFVLGLQVKGLHYGLGTISTIALFFMYWLCYQHGEAPWKQAPNEQGRYLWFAQFKEPEPEAEYQAAFTEITNQLQQIKSRLRAM